MRKHLIAVIGGNSCDAETSKLAFRVGAIIAESGSVLLCGGLAGVMEAVCKGAKSKDGLTIGILPGEDKCAANTYVDIPLATGMGYSRNTLVACTADIVVALPGHYGTLSEIGFALNGKKKVYSLNSWDVPGVIKLNDVSELKNVIGELVC